MKNSYLTLFVRKIIKKIIIIAKFSNSNHFAMCTISTKILKRKFKEAYTRTKDSVNIKLKQVDLGKSIIEKH